jgi:hypothetical protein
MMGHSIDFHAALAPPDVAYQTVQPGNTLHFSWVAKYPGAFLYHCGTPPVLAHISNGSDVVQGVVEHVVARYQAYLNLTH